MTAKSVGRFSQIDTLHGYNLRHGICRFLIDALTRNIETYSLRALNLRHGICRILTDGTTRITETYSVRVSNHQHGVCNLRHGIRRSCRHDFSKACNRSNPVAIFDMVYANLRSVA